MSHHELTIRLTEEEHARLMRIAKRHDMSPVSLLQHLVLLAEEVIAEHDAKQIPEVLRS